MSRKSRTQDERYIIALYEQASLAGELDTSFDKYEVGKLAGINPKGVDAITKLLVQANFIKKSGEAEVYLTPNGERLAIELLSSSV